MHLAQFLFPTLLLTVATASQEGASNLCIPVKEEVVTPNLDPYFAACKTLIARGSELAPAELAAAHTRLGQLTHRMAFSDAERARALAEFEKAIELDPNQALAYVGRANIVKDADQKIAGYTRALSIDPAIPGAYSGCGDVYLKQGKFDAALADFSKSIELWPDAVSGYWGRGDAYAGQEKYKEALADYRIALKQLESVNAPGYLRDMVRQKITNAAYRAGVQ